MYMDDIILFAKNETELESLMQTVSLFVCLGFMAYQPLWVIKCQIHFYANEQFYFKQFSLA